jgi:NAD(P)-dependent dehydrogenase (short-subunit alcohol dehydrogenase family)
MKAKDKVALITGGGSGIGKATAILFAKEGAKVVITGRTEKTLKETMEGAKKERLEIDYIVSDVAREGDCIKAVGYTINKYGRIDILFNNASVTTLGATHETIKEDWDEVFGINVRGTYLMSKYAIPHMLEQGKGYIVNNSSVVGLKAVPGAAAYNASKGAVTQLTRTMALEYADKGIRVSGICPGAILTPMAERMLNDPGTRDLLDSMQPIVRCLGRFGKPEEIAQAVVFLCDDDVAYMTGTMLSVDGGWITK